MSSDYSAQWIWTVHQDRRKPNQYVDFRHTYVSDGAPGIYTLKVSADSSYVIWINEERVGNGHISCYPDDRTYNQYDVSRYIQRGNNRIAVQVHYCGVNHSSYISGDACMWFALERDGHLLTQSDRKTISRPSPYYASMGTSRITPQRGFNFCCDVTGEGHQFQESPAGTYGWRESVPVDIGSSPRPSPVAVLDVDEFTQGCIVAQGYLRRGSCKPYGMLMQHDYLSSRRPWEVFLEQSMSDGPVCGPVKVAEVDPKEADGIYIVYDLGHEECGYIELELIATASCTIDMALGEHLHDLRVRSSIDGRDFGSRYVAKQGAQKFTHWHQRYAGRYIQLHITRIHGIIQLTRVGLRMARYPVSEPGRYQGDDAIANQIWHIASRTLKLCMHEHYEDCPWREQALYANDARSQMISGYYAYGNYEYARENIDLLAHVYDSSGYLNLCAPMDSELTIPGFTMAWYLSLRDYFIYSGDYAYIRCVMPRVKKMLQLLTSNVVGGLMPCPQGQRYWQYYDWAPGLNGAMDGDYPHNQWVEDVRYDAPLNALWILALNAVAQVAHYVDQDLELWCNTIVKRSIGIIHDQFYDTGKKCYQTYIGKSTQTHYSELTQALMILAGVGTEETREELRRVLVTNDTDMVPTTLSQSLYKYEAVLQQRVYGPIVYRRIRESWSSMLYDGATSFWETARGAWDFGHAGSLCHGWSGIPIYLYGAYGLGVKPTAPGYARVKIDPVMALGTTEGVVPTPHGDIEISLKADGRGTRVESSVPDGIEVENAGVHKNDTKNITSKNIVINSYTWPHIAACNTVRESDDKHKK